MIFILALVIAALISLLFAPCEPSFTSTCLIDQLDRFQTLIAGLVGFGGLIAAAIYNGQQDRAKEQRAEERRARNLASALSLESRELGIECAYLALSADEVLAALKKQGARPDQKAARFKERFREAVQPQDLLLEQISPEKLSELGFNAYGFARLTQLVLRQTRFRAGDAPVGEQTRADITQWFEEMSSRYFRCSATKKATLMCGPSGSALGTTPSATSP